MPLRSSDSLILCSDGLWAPLSPETIGSTVQKMGILRAAPALLDEAERRAGRECDNLSLVAVTWEGPARANTRRTSAETLHANSGDDTARPATRERTNS